jgi:hypothetical protein
MGRIPCFSGKWVRKLRFPDNSIDFPLPCGIYFLRRLIMAEITGEGLTFEKVWAMFQETDRRLKESREETDRRLKESSQETDRRLKESREETDRFLKESRKETDREIKEVSRIVGDLGNKFGKLSEYLVVPNMMEKFNALGYVFTKTGRNIEIRSLDNTIVTEIDILLENGDFALIVEVKSDLAEHHVTEHVTRMEKLRRYWDDHNDRRRLLGAVAGAIMTDKVKAFALKMGFYVIVQSGDTVKIEIPDGFSPRTW